MEIEIVPEPTSAERQAIVAALAAEDEEDGCAEPAAYRSAWRRAALRPDDDPGTC